MLRLVVFSQFRSEGLIMYPQHPLVTAEAASHHDWADWRWQQRNTIRTLDQIAAAFPGLPLDNIEKHLATRKIQITPYYARLIHESGSQSELTENPLARQVFPYWSEELEEGYDSATDNWELAHEMKTPICQHKYDNRVILRIANTCNAYCQFCFEALRTIETKTAKSSIGQDSWDETLAYIAANDAIEEVIFSGGEPLILSDAKIEKYLSDVRRARPDVLLRIHSRILTFNPYRVTDQLIASMGRHHVNAFGVHVCHPDEITPDFVAAVNRIRTAVPITFANIPLLRGINDSYETLVRLFLGLYRVGVVPYYLYHYMPLSPGSTEYSSSIRAMIAIMKRIKRRKSNIAVPEYVLPHRQGKFTVPLIEGSADVPLIVSDENGQQFYEFRNWQGTTVRWREY
jgi:lysine 2,3-aminomutase